jgi:lantibiotic modifying enzyme
MSWHPILDDELLEASHEALRDIARDLVSVLDESKPDPSLSGGDAGIAMFFANLSTAFPGEGYQRIADQFLTRAIDAVSEVEMTPSFYGGFPGIAYAAAYLQNHFEESRETVDLDEIDEALTSYLQATPWQTYYDLVNGLVGLGVYMLNRLPRAQAVTNLERIVAHLHQLAKRGEEGITWRTPPEQLPTASREEYPDGWYNLGVAHGVPGVIGLLSEICAMDIAQPQARVLLDGAVRWMLTQKLPQGATALFEMCKGSAHKPSPARLAWCYGDAGIAVTLMRAAQCTGTAEWAREASAIAAAARDRPLHESGVCDSCLCHGTAGLAHIFNRFYQSTGEEPFKQAALVWFDHTLKLRRPGQGFGGFLYYYLEGQDVQWLPRPGILEGSAGIGLALLAAVTDVEPTWDRILLTSLQV